MSETLNSKMARWNLKLKAFLHDPPHKLTVSFLQKRPHEEVARAIIELFMGLSEVPTEEERRRIELADWLSAAMTRLLVEDVQITEEAILEDIERTGHIPVRDPWSGSEDRGLYARIRLVPAMKTVRSLLDPHGEATDFFRFLLVYRLWPDMLADDVGPARRAIMLDFPADTRAPNHSLFEHLTQVSALVACLPRPALLLASIGPVQSFISTARKTADLLAGSYLLSYLAWQGIEGIVQELGPDHVIFPSLLHLGLFDWWLLRQLRAVNQPLDEILKKRPYPWNRLVRVANIPNRFLALVPWADMTDAWPRRVRCRILGRWKILVFWALQLAESAVQRRTTQSMDEALQSIMSTPGSWDWDSAPGEFRAWAEKAWSDAGSYFRVTALQVPIDLQAASADDEALMKPEALDRLLKTYVDWVPQDPDWTVIQYIRHHPRYRRIPVTLAYSLVHGLLERFHAAAKVQHADAYPRLDLTGRMCSLCGERVELGTIWAKARAQAGLLPGEFRSMTQASEEQFWKPLRLPNAGWPVLVREGEYLCGVCWTKRTFLYFLNRELGEELRGIEYFSRFPSTHEVGAFAFKRDILRHKEAILTDSTLSQAVRDVVDHGRQVPPSLDRSVQTWTAEALWRDAKDTPLLSEFIHIAGEWLTGQEVDLEDMAREFNLPSQDVSWKVWVREMVRKVRVFQHAWEKAIGPCPPVHTYYALVLMDGDHMGQWLSGRRNPSIGEVLHPRIVEHFRHKTELREFLSRRHPMSPAWHAALSRRLSEFAGRHVLELCTERYDAQLIYAGGDDALLMTSVRDALRLAYEIRQAFREHVLKRGDMSAGIVFAHVKAPFSIALQEVRAAERSAKERRGRGAFEIRILKRFGDLVTTGFHWEVGDPSLPVVEVVDRLYQAFLKTKGGLSTRFVYRYATDLAQLYGPEEGGATESLRPVAASLLKFHFQRSLEETKAEDHEAIWRGLTTLLDGTQSLQDFVHFLLAVAFMARPEESA